MEIHAFSSKPRSLILQACPQEYCLLHPLTTSMSDSQACSRQASTHLPNAVFFAMYRLHPVLHSAFDGVFLEQDFLVLLQSLQRRNMCPRIFGLHLPFFPFFLDWQLDIHFRSSKPRSLILQACPQEYCLLHPLTTSTSDLQSSFRQASRQSSNGPIIKSKRLVMNYTNT